MEGCLSLEVLTLCECILARATRAQAEAIGVAACKAIQRCDSEQAAARRAFAQELIPTLGALDVWLGFEPYILYIMQTGPEQQPGLAYRWGFDAAAPSFSAAAVAPFTVETHRKIVAFIKSQK